MATKRLDQLPSGSDFDMNDLVMIEQDPDTFDRKLVKTSLSDFMGSALKFDPERFGQNPITGFQSQFQWLMSSMNTLSNMSLLSETLDPYAEVQAADSTESQYLPTPTPSITASTSSLIPSLTPTITPTVTPTITPTQSTPSMISTQQITFNGAEAEDLIALEIPNEYMPEFIGDYRLGGQVLRATGWDFVSNFGYYNQNDPTEPENYETTPFFDVYKFPEYEAYPYNFTRSSLGEKLYRFAKLEYGNNLSNRVAIAVVPQGADGYDFKTPTPLIDGSSITFTIRYLY